MENQIKEEKTAKDKVIKDYENVTGKYTKLQDDFQNKQNNYDLLHKNYTKKMLDLKVNKLNNVLKNNNKQISRKKKTKQYI